MRERTMRREPVFGDEPDHEASPLYRHEDHRASERSHTRRLMAAPGRLLAFVVLSGLVSAFIANALYFQKGPRPALWFDTSALWRSTLSLNPLNLFIRPALEHAPSTDPAPQPPRRSDKGEAVPVPSPVAVSAPTSPAQANPAPPAKAPVNLVASADPKQVFAPPLAIPAPDTTDPVGALVAQTMPKPDKTILAVQRALNKLGYGPMAPDGLKSAGLHDALIRFQKDKHLPATGDIDMVTKPQLAKASGLALE
jgi:hypothetical protein